MALVDDVTIKVKAGNGGNGAKSFSSVFGTMKRVPDGGSGGRGGNVIFKGSSNIHDLSEFRFRKEVKAENGENGGHKNLTGRGGEDIEVLLPLGTTIIDVNSNDVTDIVSHDESFVVCYGGQGGMGTHDYKPDVEHFVPRKSEGDKGQEREIHLVLNLIADIGFVGLPNAGKSSLLSVLTRATPKIGDYPFTTLEPQLGTMDGAVLADIPGLIEGAHEGKGLGLQFLKHIQKTKTLLFCIDATEENPLATYEALRYELGEYDATLLDKQEAILLTKQDLVEESDLKKKINEFKKAQKVLIASIYNDDSIKALKKELLKLI